MLDEQLYLSKVRRTQDKVEAALLGQNFQLETILPKHLKGLDDKKKAKQITAQLIFALAKTPEGKRTSPEELHLCSEWLRTTIYYLLTQCDEKSQTFYEMKSLMFLSKTAREIIFRDLWGLHSSAVMGKEAPVLFKELDLAILWTLKATGQISKAKEMHVKIQELVSVKLDS